MGGDNLSLRKPLKVMKEHLHRVHHSRHTPKESSNYKENILFKYRQFHAFSKAAIGNWHKKT